MLALLFTIYQLSIWPIFWSAFTTNHKPIYSEVRLNCIWSLPFWIIKEKKNISIQPAICIKFIYLLVCVISLGFWSSLCNLHLVSSCPSCSSLKRENLQKICFLFSHMAWHCPELHRNFVKCIIQYLNNDRDLNNSFKLIHRYN